jgi:hypothetical protein
MKREIEAVSRTIIDSLYSQAAMVKNRQFTHRLLYRLSIALSIYDME